jgi:hypothetical protein
MSALDVGRVRERRMTGRREMNFMAMKMCGRLM